MKVLRFSDQFANQLKSHFFLSALIASLNKMVRSTAIHERLLIFSATFIVLLLTNLWYNYFKIEQAILCLLKTNIAVSVS
jgi:hypothetical protein